MFLVLLKLDIPNHVFSGEPLVLARSIITKTVPIFCSIIFIVDRLIVRADNPIIYNSIHSTPTIVNIVTEAIITTKNWIMSVVLENIDL